MSFRKPPALQRRNELAAIHAGKKQLGLDDDTYRGLLESVTGQRSAADLDPPQRRRVLDRMRELGKATTPKTPAGSYPDKPANFDNKPMLARVEQLLTAMQLPWRYADSIARHMYGIDRVAWLKTEAQLRGVIAALDAEQHRRGLRVAILTERMRVGLDEAEMIERFRLPKNWRGNRDGLQRVHEALTAMPSKDGG